ncbi:MAG TPA: flagellar biosynthesis repressor FlbT [Candidatus Binatia bacterium]|nr:flagellar biosynthesis repressor FlbT [Candidatus Binatia bacterium]
MPLKFTLKPGEKVIVNGAVIGRGEEPGSFYLYNKVKFLRGREVMKEEQADSLEKKLYLIIQLIYLFPESAAENVVKFESIWEEVSRQRPGDREKLAEVARLVQSEDYYRALKLTAKLF